MKISVCMATYNGEKYLQQQLDSILSQLGIDDELIISDDGSTDKTLDIIQQYNDKRITLLAKEVFRSPIFNFENAIKHAQGDIIVLSDQDDLWESNKISVIKESFQLENLSDTVLKMYNGICIDENGKTLHQSLFEYLNIREGFFQNIVKNSFIGCNIAFTKPLLEKVLPFPKNIPMHDMWLGCNAYLYGKVEFVDKKIFNYRIHENNYSIKNTSVLQKIVWRKDLVMSLLRRYVDVKFRS